MGYSEYNVYKNCDKTGRKLLPASAARYHQKYQKDMQKHQTEKNGACMQITDGVKAEALMPDAVQKAFNILRKYLSVSGKQKGIMKVTAILSGVRKPD